MTKKRSVTFNHISKEVSKENIEKLMCFYKLCHRQCWAHKRLFKFYQQMNILGNVSSAIIGTVTVSTVVVTSSLSLLILGALGVSIQAVMKLKDLSSKIANTKYVFQNYDHLKNLIKEQLRSGQIDIDVIIKKMSFIEDLKIDLCPNASKYLKIYDKKYKTSNDNSPSTS